MKRLALIVALFAMVQGVEARGRKAKMDKEMGCCPKKGKGSMKRDRGGMKRKDGMKKHRMRRNAKTSKEMIKDETKAQPRNHTRKKEVTAQSSRITRCRQKDKTPEVK